jgi:hypothetical protein
MRLFTAFAVCWAFFFCCFTFTFAAEPTGENLSPFEENGKWGYKDEGGHVVIKPEYDDARQFAFGLAPVNKGAKWEIPHYKKGGKWGYINTKGDVIIPFTLEHAHEFSDGLAQVWDKKGTRYLDVKGKTVIDLGHITAGNFSEGVAPVYLDRSLKGQDWQTKYIDKEGKTSFTVDGYGNEFHEGLAVISERIPKTQEGRLYGFIDKKGTRAIPPRFAEAFDFSEGLAAVRTKKTTVWGKGDTWGYIDKKGDYVIEPQFNETHRFIKGVARVHLGGKLLVLMDAPPYWEGGEWCLIDKQGKILKRSEKWLDYKDAETPKSP